MRTLYFEGAGWEDADSSKATIGNCRIRTVFKDKKGKEIYLELLCCNKNEKKYGAGDSPYFGMVDFAYYTDGKDAINKSKNWVIDRNYKFTYSEQCILELINSINGVEPFDKIQVVNHLGGYRVFRENEHDKCNLGDEFEYSEELYQRRKMIDKYFYDLEKSEGKKYPNHSTWVDEDNPNVLHLMRHFEGFNKHWIIDVTDDNWFGTMKQTPLYSPGGHGVAE